MKTRRWASGLAGPLFLPVAELVSRQLALAGWTAWGDSLYILYSHTCSCESQGRRGWLRRAVLLLYCSVGCGMFSSRDPTGCERIMGLGIIKLCFCSCGGSWRHILDTLCSSFLSSQVGGSHGRSGQNCSVSVDMAGLQYLFSLAHNPFKVISICRLLICIKIS